MLSNRRAVITGASDGIGFAIAQAFVQNGASVMLLARDEQKLKEAIYAISDEPMEVKKISADLSNIEAVRNASDAVLAVWPEIDILVNNAGIARFLPFDETDEAVLSQHINLNVRAPYFFTQWLLPALEKRKGVIINISSYFSHKMLPGRPSTAYSISKGAIDAFTKSLAYELGHRGVRVNAIAPGTVDTSLVRENIQKLTEVGRKQFAEMVKVIYPLGRIGKPDDIAGAAVFLASDSARWITGAILAVDGGLTTN